jgi:hypothetical protein
MSVRTVDVCSIRYIAVSVERCFVVELMNSASGKAHAKCIWIEVLTTILRQNLYLVHTRAPLSLYQINTNKCTQRYY